MKKYLKIDIKTSSVEEEDILMASLSDIDFYAFEQGENLLHAYINEADYDEEGFHQIVPKSMVHSRVILEDTNWNSQWESNFKPVSIGDFAMIRADFHEKPAGVKYDLLITPKMSFGTGHHATTWLMVAQMEHISFEDKKVLDFGTGTGVLAILAEKMGASEVLAVDLDEWSINNTLENIEQNNCTKIKVEQRDHLGGLMPADIILANINLNILNQAASSISALQGQDSLLLVSGFLKQDVPAIETIFSEKNYQKKTQMERDNWAAILFEKKET